MNWKFPVLTIVSILLRVLGALSVLGGIYLVLFEGAVEPNLPGHAFGQGDVQQIIRGLIGIGSGLLTIASGESIGVLFAIERHTRSNEL